MKNKVIFLKGNTIVHKGRKFVNGVNEIPPALLEYFEKIKVIKIIKNDTRKINKDTGADKS